MPDPTNAERQRRFRKRKTGQLPPAQRVPCGNCPRLHSGAHGLLCCRCWERLTPDGRLAKAEQVRRSRRKAAANRNNL